MRLWRALRSRADIARVSIVKAGKHGQAIMHKVAEQGMSKAKRHGAKLAQHVIAVQKSAGAPAKMIRESARSIAARPMRMKADAMWQQGYVAEMSKHVPGLLPEREPAMAPPAPAGPERPVWPHAGPSGPARNDREAGS